MSDSLSVIFRADDAGVNRSATEAIVACARAGLVRNIGVMIPPTPDAEAVAELRSLPEGVTLGLHATVTSEWEGQRWGPVLGAEAVPSLVRADGTFHENSQAMKGVVDLDELNRELRAQLARALKWGLEPTYLDTHMGFSWLPGVADLIQTICDEHGLVFSNTDRFQGLPKPPEGTADEAHARLLGRIEAAEAGGTYVAVFHPSYDHDDSRGMFRAESPWEKIIANRKAEAAMLCDPAFVQEILGRGVKPVTYAEAALI